MTVTLSEIIKDLVKKRRQPTPGTPIPTLTLTSTVVACYNTINQREALKPLIDALSLEADILTKIPNEPTNIPGIEHLTRIALKYSPNLVGWYFSLPPYQKKVYRSRYYNYFFHLGLYRFLLNAFKNSPAKYYIAANDHSGVSQIGFVAARDAGLKTIYVQHAAVSDLFPPLMVDYALLDGEDARQKYLNAGSTKAEIHLIGTMKYDPYLQKTLDRGPNVGVCIGIAANDIEQNIALCRQLDKNRETFTVRFHPAVSSEVRERFTAHNWKVSLPEDENALDFILRCHSIISGDSTILLEAIILKRRPLYFASDGVGLDYYGFLKTGILDNVWYRHEHVLQALSRPFDIEKHRLKAKHYCATLYTDDEANSTTRAVGILENILNGSK